MNYRVINNNSGLVMLEFSASDSWTEALELALALLDATLERKPDEEEFWYWELLSDMHDIKTFGSYENYNKALAGQARVRAQAARNNDDLKRFYGTPYKK